MLMKPSVGQHGRVNAPLRLTRKDKMTLRHGLPRLLLLCLCLSVLSTVTGCYVAPTSYGTSASGGGTADETRQDRKPWGRQDGGPYRPWERLHSGPNANE